MENWKEIPGYQGRYKASDLGNIKSTRKNYHELIMKPSVGSKKYLSLVLGNKNFMVHRLVAMCFCDNPYNKLFVNHKDGNKLNNKASNLEWCSFQENMDHAYYNGLMHKHKGSTHHFTKFNDIDIFNIRFLRSELKVPFCIIAEFYNVSHPINKRNM